ncbi:MAG: DNA adenine methylase [Chloroflexi bacterium]|nr:DNA adenine methylase [Chloroflexota bacterium]
MTRRPNPIYLEEKEAEKTENGIHRGRGKNGHLIVFGWYGGKFSHLNWLLPLLPECHHYCEPFAGSAAVLLNRKPSPVETYNDIDGEVVNFFHVLRENADGLIRLIALTPFSREEYHRAVVADPKMYSDLERARLFYVRARQSRTGLAQTASLGRWANCKETSRSGMSGVVSRWLGGVDALPEIAERLLRVQIENRPATDVIRLYDGPETLFYCDPPYLHSTRGDDNAYAFEMDEEEHKSLAQVLRNCIGKVAISGYRNELMDDLFNGWFRFDAPIKTIHSVKKLRQECVWMNYNPESLTYANNRSHSSPGVAQHKLLDS